MDDGRWRTTITTTQQSNSAWEMEEEDGGSDEQQQIPQLIWRDYDWGKEEGLHLPCKSEGGMDATTAMVMGNNNQGRKNQPISESDEGGLNHG